MAISAYFCNGFTTFVFCS